MFVGLKNICNFVKSIQSRRNLQLIFLTNKESLTSSAITKVPLPILDCVDRTDGAIPLTKLNLMSTGKKFVNASAYATFIQLQKEGDNLKQSNFSKRSDYFEACINNIRQQHKYARIAYAAFFDKSKSEPLKPAAL